MHILDDHSFVASEMHIGAKWDLPRGEMLMHINKPGAIFVTVKIYIHFCVYFHFVHFMEIKNAHNNKTNILSLLE